MPKDGNRKSHERGQKGVTNTFSMSLLKFSNISSKGLRTIKLVLPSSVLFPGFSFVMTMIHSRFYFRLLRTVHCKTSLFLKMSRRYVNHLLVEDTKMHDIIGIVASSDIMNFLRYQQDRVTFTQ